MKVRFGMALRQTTGFAGTCCSAAPFSACRHGWAWLSAAAALMRLAWRRKGR
ncbi:MAG: hypothetical protein JKP98_10195 [Rhodobacteraceae bacterium]|jgi:hypothetical protein|nr:hypothetical protein [Paracoccaceae bacterium]MBL4557338.1 hypothetical protein [Paracoccaceae bacterium]